MLISRQLALTACLVATALLAACKPAPALVEPLESTRPAPAPAKTSQIPAAGASELASQYAQAKSVIRAMRESGEYSAATQDAAIEKVHAVEFGVKGAEDCANQEECALDLINCHLLGSDMLRNGLNQPMKSYLVNLADETVDLELLLAKHGYPESTWRPDLARYEEQYLQLLTSVGQKFNDTGALPEAASLREQEIGTQLWDSLTASLNAYRTTSGADVPIAYVEGGCGDGDVGINFVTEPRNAKVELITIFNYRLCRIEGKDPANHGLCDAWEEPIEGMLHSVVGDYRYRAEWPDGHVREGKLSFTNVEDGQTVTIRR